MVKCPTFLYVLAVAEIVDVRAFFGTCRLRRRMVGWWVVDRGGRSLLYSLTYVFVGGFIVQVVHPSFQFLDLSCTWVC